MFQSQKRLVLCNLKECYQCFKEEHPDVKVGFSKFAESRPPYCILAGATGTHSVCVCKIHQNCILLLYSLDLESLDSELGRCWTYDHLLTRMVCKPPTDSCYFGKFHMSTKIIKNMLS